MKKENSNTEDWQHITFIKAKVKELKDALDKSTSQVLSADTKALFLAANETIAGLYKTIESYEERNEGIWRA